MIARPVAVAPPFPSLTRVYPARAELLPAVRLGDDLVIVGDQLNDASMVRLTHVRLQDSIELPPETERTSEELTLHIPAPADPNPLSTWASGFYTLVLVVRRPSLPVWTTNAVSFPLAPTITVERPAGAPAPLAVVAGDTVTLTCAPRIRPEQEGHVELMLGMQPVPITTIATPAADTTNRRRSVSPFPRRRPGSIPSACASMGSTVCRSWSPERRPGLTLTQHRR